jgi:L-alanine-DL-glutamate epimerase-like enolase superfamily enzyme
VVEAEAAGRRGLGYSYAAAAAARIVRDVLAPAIRGLDALAIPAAWSRMVGLVRNLGRPGVGSMAIAAVDAALWDLKARLFDVPLVKLLGAARPSVPVYGSGGFTSYDNEQLASQLGGWAEAGITRVKMKVGRYPREDVARVHAARRAVGENVQLFVDANGGYTRKQALAFAAAFADEGVSWFEEPVSSDDLDGLRLMRDRAPAGMDVAAGEYGHDLVYFKRMLDAGAVDVLQADATRCAGITGFLDVGRLCAAACLPLSAHTAPSLHLHPACAMPGVVHVEYFHDHVRLERMLFDGAIDPVDGELAPDLSRPGIGLELKRKDAERYAA